MLHFPFTRTIHLALPILIILGLSSCAVYERPYGPGYVRQAPPPAGVVYYDYWYYPEAHVYFDVNRRVYFYYTNKRWVETRVLPPSWRSRLHSHVPIQSREARPYLEYREHSHKYPPRYRDERRERERYEERNAPRYRNDVYPRNYQEQPRKEPPPRTWKQLLEQQHERESRTQQQPGSNIKSPVRQRYHEQPRKEPVNNAKNKAHEKARGKNGKDTRRKNDKNDKSRRSRDEDQRDDQDRERRDYRR